MIDTDKYEGHTPAPWDKLSEYCPVGSIDRKLIADAPLLLAEVKRLREGIKKIASDYDFITIKSSSRTKPRPAYNVPAGDGIHTVTFRQKACLKILELIE